MDKATGKERFDLKKMFADLLDSADKPAADPRIISTLGIFGILIILVAIAIKVWDGWSGWTTASASRAGQNVLLQVDAAVQSFRGIHENEAFLQLASQAFDDPGSLPAVQQWLENRIGAGVEVQLHPGTVDDMVPEEMGPNGFALVSMMYIAEQGNIPALQIHYSLEPPRLVQVVEVRDDSGPIGYLSFTADPAPVLQAFNPDVGKNGYVALRQDYGGQTRAPIKQAGDPSKAPSQPDSRLVPGSMFRVEWPLHQANELLPWGQFITIVVVGLLMFGASRFLHAKNERWLVAAELRRASEKAAREKREAQIAAERKAAALQAETERKGGSDKGAADRVKAVEGRESKSGTAEPPPLRLRYDIASRRRKPEVEIPPVELTESIFRAYDIRGVIGKSLDVEVARQVGQAVGSTALDNDAGPVVVARDGRLSGPQLVEGLIDGIVSSGCDVLDIGMVPTGVLYFAAFEKANGSGVMLTGSHNPPDYNGFKVMIGGATLFGDQIKALYRRISTGDLRVGRGDVVEEDVVPAYCDRISREIQLEKPLKVVVDCGNGVGGVCAAQALRAAGAEVMPLFDEVDGTFPNHHPDPSEPENLLDLIDSVKLMGADLGLALDGDADRLGVVTANGDIIYPDRVMILLARDVLSRVPGATIIYDVKCTGLLAKAIEDAGGKPMMYKTGHSLIKARMKEMGSPFAGEMSGHFFFEERWYGVDDGIYGGARLLEILAASEQTPTEILSALPSSVSTPELKVEMQEGENHAFIERFQRESRFPNARVSTIDGVRADFEDGWGLCRASNTTPVLIVRFDADNKDALDRIKRKFAQQMLEINPDLQLPPEIGAITRTF